MKQVPYTLSFALWLALVGVAAAQIAPEPTELNSILNVKASQIVSIDVQQAADGSVIAYVPLPEATYTLMLAPHSMRSANYRVLAQLADGSYQELEPGPVNTLRGIVAEEPGAVVAGALNPDGFDAVIDLPDRLWIEPLARHMRGATPDQFAVYRQSDVLASGGRCGGPDSVVLPIEDRDHTKGSAGGGGSNQRAGFVAELAVDVDVEYFNIYVTVAATESRVNSVMNTVDVQYSRDVDIDHTISTIIVRTAEPDPYTSTDAGTLLGQFRSHWLANHTGVDRDVALLFTGKQINGSVVGIAWTIGGICTSNAYCLAQVNCCGSFGCATDLVAHELGHLWGGSHCTCSTSTMNASLTCTNNFNATSQGQIIGHRNSRTCLNDCTGSPITQQPASQTACSGDQVIISIATNLVVPTYQWRKNSVNLVDGGNIIGATGPFLVLLSAAAGDAGTYDCVVTDVLTSCVVTSSDAELTIGLAPQITGHPAAQTVDPGDVAFFSVVTSEPSILFAFQWRKDGADLVDGGTLVGAQSSFLVNTAVQESDEGSYDCVVTRLIGGCALTSNAALLTVNDVGGCPNPQSACDGSDIAPVGGDCLVDLSDLGVLLANFAPGVGGKTRDQGDIFGSDGIVDLSDLGQMLADFGTDCR